MSDVDQYTTVFNQTLDVANKTYKSSDWDQAVERFKSVGAVGAQQLGPAIDAQTGEASSALTQEAWNLNGQLAVINSGAYNGTAATQADADAASSLVSQMWQAYGQALAGVTTAPAASVTAPKPTARPGTFTPATSSAPASGAKTSSLSLGAVVGGALVGAAVVGVALGTLPAAIGGAVAGTLVGALLGKKGA